MTVDHHGLIADLHRAVGDALQVERRRRERSNLAELGPQDEEQFALAQLTRLLLEQSQDAMAAGHDALDPVIQESLRDAVMARIFGSGSLEPLLADPEIEEINLNGTRVFVTRAGSDVPEELAPIASTNEDVIELIRGLAASESLNPRSFDEANPHVRVRLRDGSRLAALMSVTAVPVASIRRHRHKQVSLDDLVENCTLSEDVAGFLRAVVRARKQVIIAGGTNSGKTTLLRALLRETDTFERLITVESVYELALDEDPLHPNVVALEARLPNSEGRGEVTVQKLVDATRQLSPDRVIVGEVQGEEVLPMLMAMSQGNSGSMSTIHTSSARATFDRIATYARLAKSMGNEEAHQLAAGALDFVIYIERDRRTKRRVVREILEVTGFDQVVSTNAIFTAGSDGRATRTDVAVACEDDLVAAGWAAGFADSSLHAVAEDSTRWGWGQ